MRHAFSLVELSIVLVILGLLVGGVLSGQSLIHAAQLRSVTTSFNKYNTAMLTFRDKYFQLPGDFNMATKFWPAAASCATTTTTTTCNGDGNGVVAYVYTPPNGTSVNASEAALFFQHMALAGLIEGAYTGQWSQTVGQSWPPAKLGNGYYSIPADPSSGGMPTAASYTSLAGEKPILTIGVACTDIVAGGNPNGCGGVMKMEDAWNIDTKMDDGVSYSGKITASFSDNSAGGGQIPGPSTTGGNCPTYNLSDTTSLCALGFLIFD